MSSYEIRFTRTAVKDIDKLTPKLKNKLREICINTIAQNPHCGKKLVGDLDGFYSFRLTFKDRIVYTVDEKNKVVFIHRAKTHYGD
ncbi:MAG TPA: type II toxin-antitoxin system mRNA interferase toxin, RelE/StbE family [Lentisphaeria bacterium]|nr:MAG: toxin of toxin-antitoxin system [Lentisphaerae bacterium GWF2_49_21]HBC89452.1 type II toxin-antitoxin system mRNA interferase toxin, RelE/StbE family [Lentisphaeria bacterium]